MTSLSVTYYPVLDLLRDFERNTGCVPSMTAGRWQMLWAAAPAKKEN